VNPTQTIARKRDGHSLTRDEIAAFVRGFVQGEIPDYQMSAMAMAIFLRGMNDDETAELTREMLLSGTTLRWSANTPPKVDKHSTGGIGDKTSLILAPLLACCGLQVPMISGRGLGATGGTLDKLESIPGFRTDLTPQEMCDQVERVGCVITGTTDEIAPADRKLYALRDVTATVASVPLITASIMSKKLAEGLDALVLDVKWGSGAFMKSLDLARALSKSLVAVGNQMGVPTTALLTDMNQPLGRMVGGTVEMDESVAGLTGHGPADLMQLVVALGTELLVSAGAAASVDDARRRLVDELNSGRALEKLHEMVKAQGGDLDAPRPLADESTVSTADEGLICSIDAERLGLAVIEMGGGRKRLGDQIDHSVGLQMLVRIGDHVQPGQPLVHLYAAQPVSQRLRGLVQQAFVIGRDAAEERPLILERHGESGVG